MLEADCPKLKGNTYYFERYFLRLLLSLFISRIDDFFTAGGLQQYSYCVSVWGLRGEALDGTGSVANFGLSIRL